MNEIMMIRSENGLVPATDTDRILLKQSYPFGQPLRTVCRKWTQRSLQHHRLYFGGLIGLVKEYWDGEDVQLTTKSEQAIANMFCGFLQSRGISVDAASALIQEFLQSINDRRAEQYTPLPPTTDDIHEWIKLKTGYVDLVKNPDGHVICKTKSISFAKMSQTEFNVFFKKAVDVCWKFILSRQFRSPQELENAAYQILEMA